MNKVLRSVLAGSASGGRSFTGLGALTLTAAATGGTQPDATLATPWVRGLSTLFAGSELVIDKVPTAPSRWQPPGLIVRCLTAAGCGAVIARRVRAVTPAPLGANSVPDPTAGYSPLSSTAVTVLCAASAAGAALAAAWVGVRWRSAASKRLGSDFAGAVIEDAWVLALAYLAARPEPSSG